MLSIFLFYKFKNDYDSHDQNHPVPNHLIISQDHDPLTLAHNINCKSTDIVNDQEDFKQLNILIFTPLKKLRYLTC
ncbi:hypothetical protein VIGAN_04023300 [Vigna angularis var. angularis]|uniref:Uncharacterized protein n=1 Tax=Vigna angularis var. angularis TaxID=157739 RepID=A0A0S3RRB1_PHAAN|nr:hypothetical protein VIGAN_04023300 [Vigna angularis var. angularis]